MDFFRYIICLQFVFAQEKTVTGVVSDAGQPVTSKDQRSIQTDFNQYAIQQSR
jgi:hypothetical protein